MSASSPTRREFLASSTTALGSGWLALHWPVIVTLAGCAREDARANAEFSTLGPERGAAMRAFAARIIPSDPELPGAEEAGAAWFVDRALAGPFAGMKDPVVAGLDELNARSREAHDVAFDEATAEQQDALMRAIEQTPFFGMARLLVLAGTFADPLHGGNRDHVGWRILGFDHQSGYQPPFGWYDAQVTGGTA